MKLPHSHFSKEIQSSLSSILCSLIYIKESVFLLRLPSPQGFSPRVAVLAHMCRMFDQFKTKQKTILRHFGHACYRGRLPVSKAAARDVDWLLHVIARSKQLHAYDAYTISYFKNKTKSYSSVHVVTQICGQLILYIGISSDF